ncbi:glutamine--fructose-6-phosphate transaminase (isomerizing) [Aerococcaceae bacterium zg-BR9]|uniref:glutamine--fructose-6-phosphate transaminase (isomerizing) n=1 Tax=Aerococcaceae bacterium zg-1292 TaxID=2774330 RepID=UPI0040629371|nr:glutamine--fructose-6-phosphate transaminase (isomerizing) [Aerococcaceae bacterium zg-BR9]MBF6977993.1 glutamine--fructose-6-phosphate transaminase (isomerizing) [Aerococcaceae bacterium zg-BR22]MBF6979229.1 glutamine--fructose-6-phosphate transaminase (isomerizing) [Aerococcaceae bacterium zg-BR22]
MCGVVGFIGKGNVQQELITGLEKLEYRGYDSAGIFVMSQEEKSLFKEVGRIAQLKEVVDFEQAASVGIGHTRWATHGPATQYNAHPHVSSTGRFVLVHNGVIENYAEIKAHYLQAIEFKSDTDTEVAVNLVEYFALQEGLAAKDAFNRALSIIEGSYAFGLIDCENPDVLYAAKNKSPLLIGLSDEFNVICSDAMAAIHLTNQYLEIKDKELVTLTADDVVIETFDGIVVERDAFVAELDASDLEKGAYPFYMIKEIDEQPTVIRRLLQEYGKGDNQFDIDEALLEAVANADRLHVVACGTSYHAGFVGKTLFEKLVGIPVELHLASEFAYDLPIFSERPLFIFLTQSGETADSRQALVKVNELGYPSLTITNVKGSTLSREATYTLLLHAGPEIAVASTKAYTAQIAVMAILAEALRHRLERPERFNMLTELSKVATVMESILAEKDLIEQWVTDNLMKTRNAFYIGRLSDYYVAMEAALKLKEISYIQTEAFAAGELKHGTIALIEEGTPVIALISDATVASHTRGNVEEVKARGAKAMVISTKDSANEEDLLVLPKLETLLSPLATVVVTQLIAYYTALGRGLDVDKPRNLAKSVTVE